jgi:glycosyl transferase, family 25
MGNFQAASRASICEMTSEFTPVKQMNTLPDLFGVAYLINLPERVDRLKSAQRQLARVGWDIGPSGVNVFPALRYADPAGFPNAPIRGCFYSHLECLRRANADGRQSVLILEDDIGLTTSLPRLTSSIRLQIATKKWDFVYFAYDGTDHTDTANRGTSKDELTFDEWTGALVTCSFYGVSGRILSRLIAHLNRLASGRRGDQEEGPMPIDGAYNIFRWHNPDVRCMIARPRLGWQVPSRSDITPHVLDKLTFLRPVNALLRRFKQMATSLGS